MSFLDIEHLIVGFIHRHYPSEHYCSNICCVSSVTEDDHTNEANLPSVDHKEMKPRKRDHVAGRCYNQIQLSRKPETRMTTDTGHRTQAGSDLHMKDCSVEFPCTKWAPRCQSRMFHQIFQLECRIRSETLLESWISVFHIQIMSILQANVLFGTQITKKPECWIEWKSSLWSYAECNF